MAAADATATAAATDAEAPQEDSFRLASISYFFMDSEEGEDDDASSVPVGSKQQSSSTTSAVSSTSRAVPQPANSNLRQQETVRGPFMHASMLTSLHLSSVTLVGAASSLQCIAALAQLQELELVDIGCSAECTADTFKNPSTCLYGRKGRVLGAAVQQLRQLTHLKLELANMTSSAAAGLHKLPQLRSLTLSNRGTYSSHIFRTVPVSLTALDILEFQGTYSASISPSGLEQLTGLRCLRLHRGQVRSVHTLSCLSKLTCLDLQVLACTAALRLDLPQLAHLSLRARYDTDITGFDLLGVQCSS
jgi:hypothetical protein